MKNYFFLFIFLAYSIFAGSQSVKRSMQPPMGWMSWNLMQETINEKDVKEMAEAMIANGMVAAGYKYIFIDDCWQGGRDSRNNIIADPKKFPSGIKALADYLHARGMKLGIYSDAAPLTCAGFTGSLHFEKQDAKTFASWGIDFLKYDYCGAPEDMETAKIRYNTMADALHNSGRDIVFSICEWGVRKPWLWGAEAGGQLWRTTYDIRDKWKNTSNKSNSEGIIDVLDINANLHEYAGGGKWNDADMLVAGLYGLKGPSAYSAGKGCTDIEYRSQFSLWAIMNSPMYASCDIRTMNEATTRILLNEEVIALNQDSLGKQAVRVVNNPTWNIFVKPLANNEYAVAVLNRSDSIQTTTINFQDLGLAGNYEIRDLWEHTKKGKGKTWKVVVDIHETKVFRLTSK
jgi:alpha-galactosidase